jgi:hypothetical protein
MQAEKAAWTIVFLSVNVEATPRASVDAGTGEAAIVDKLACGNRTNTIDAPPSLPLALSPV